MSYLNIKFNFKLNFPLKEVQLLTSAASIEQSVQYIGYDLDNLGINSQQRQQVFLFFKMFTPALGAHPASYSLYTRDSYREGNVAKV